MLLQPFIENSLKHGIKYLEEGKGIVEVAVVPVKGGLQYTITDNGVGRELTSKYKSKFATGHQSKGIQLSEKRVALLKNEVFSPSISIIDLKDASGSPCGTRVEIVLPGI
jgi:sensor histidine kinase YesM